MSALQKSEEVALSSAERRRSLADRASARRSQSRTRLRDVEEASRATLPEVAFDAVDPSIPTEEDRATLRRVPGRVPWAAYLIAFVELAERFSYYGSSVVFTNFIQQPLPPGSRAGNDPTQPGALGLGQQAAKAITTTNTFWMYFIALLAAYLADERLGRYKTLMWAVGFAMVGHVLLIVAALPDVIAVPKGSLATLIIGIIVMGVGTGAFKPNISPLVAEQADTATMKIKTLESGERVIEDPSLTIAKIFEAFYWLINFGALGGQISMVYAEKGVGFWLSFTLPTIIFFLCPIVLYIGRNRYVRRPPAGSATSKAARLFVFAAQGRWSWDAIKPSNVSPRPHWMTFDDAFVDELKRGLSACKVFVFFILWNICYNQMNSNLIAQAAVMQRHGVPNDILSNLNPLAVLIMVPIFSYVIYPTLRYYRIRITPIRRISAGFIAASGAMFWALTVQIFIYRLSPCGHQAATCGADKVAPISVWYQSGPYILISLSEILANITALEYAFTKAPKSMRSLVTALFWFANALAAVVDFIILPLSRDPNLEWNYGVLGVLSFIAGIAFYIVFRKLDIDEEELNALAEGDLHGSGPVADSLGNEKQQEAAMGVILSNYQEGKSSQGEEAVVQKVE